MSIAKGNESGKKLELLFLKSITIEIKNGKNIYFMRSGTRGSDTSQGFKKTSKGGLDFIGCYEGRYVSIECKSEQSYTSISLNRISFYQYEVGSMIRKAKGIALCLIEFSSRCEYYLVPISYLRNMLDEGKKSVKVESLEPFQIKYTPRPKSFIVSDMIQSLIDKDFL